jgi:pimeloyl-ACP methyl ester carboxylesterase
LHFLLLETARFADRECRRVETRRGHGQSEFTDNGYDIDTRVKDILVFLDTMKIEKVILIGHSIAGNEMTFIAEHYPDRLMKLVYLDAARDGSEIETLEKDDPLKDYSPDIADEDWMASFEKFTEFIRLTWPFINKDWGEIWKNQLRDIVDIDENGGVVPRTKPRAGEAMEKSMREYHPDFSCIKCPALSFYPLLNEHPQMPSDADNQLKKKLKYYLDKSNAKTRGDAKDFKENVTLGQVVLLEDANHTFFISKEAETVRKIRKFLSSN